MPIPVCLSITVLFGFGTASFLVGLVFLALLWLVLENERAEFQTQINIGAAAAGFAV